MLKELSVLLHFGQLSPHRREWLLCSDPMLVLREEVTNVDVFTTLHRKVMLQEDVRAWSIPTPLAFLYLPERLVKWEPVFG